MTATSMYNPSGDRMLRRRFCCFCCLALHWLVLYGGFALHNGLARRRCSRLLWRRGFLLIVCHRLAELAQCAKRRVCHLVHRISVATADKRPPVQVFGGLPELAQRPAQR